jgi:hypothetical protein
MEEYYFNKICIFRSYGSVTAQYFELDIKRFTSFRVGVTEAVNFKMMFTPTFTESHHFFQQLGHDDAVDKTIFPYKGKRLS